MNTEQKIVVAMSGGVDSSVAALLLAKDYSDILGVSMQVWDYRNNGGCSSKATCCSPDDFTDARKVAAAINIPYYVFDFEQKFRKEVINNFIETYKKGLTPNPCIDCNNKVKFRELKNRAQSFGCTHVATGHYARIEMRDNRLCLLRGKDLEKDQSYFLYGLTYEDLESTLFPVGNFQKSEVREIAKAAGLEVASKAESQDICFISGETADFIERLGGPGKPGNIVDLDGKIVGEHAGIQRYTVGQRRGLNLSGFAEPQYVLDINVKENLVSVGPKSALERADFYVKDLVFNCQIAQEFDAIAQLRHRHEGVPVRVKLEADQAHVTFTDNWTTVSPGQACVFYALDNEQLLGGGRIVQNKSERSLLRII